MTQDKIYITGGPTSGSWNAMSSTMRNPPPETPYIKATPAREAADDMLEALENLLKVHEGEGGTKYHAGDIARTAIAKAKGENT